MSLLSRFPHFRNIVLEMEMDTRSHVHFAEMRKRTILNVERCAAIYTVEGTYSDFFSCNRGLNEGKGNQQHSSTMRFSTLLRRWNPPLFRKYVREKEMAKRNSRTKFADKG